MPLEISISRESDVPLGTQLAWKLKTLIATGDLAPGEQLPGARELGDAVGVNVNTVRGVFRRLEEDGLLRSEHGRGTFVARRQPAGDDLARITAEAIEHARRAGIDPRDLAAALFVARPTRPEDAAPEPPEADPPEQPPGSATPPGDERELRRRLRTEIQQLEGELARIEPLTATPARPREPGGRLLSAGELRTVRDELAGRVSALRRVDNALRDQARQAREEARRTSEQEAERLRGTWAHSGASTGARARPARVAWTHNW